MARKQYRKPERSERDELMFQVISGRYGPTITEWKVLLILLSEEDPSAVNYQHEDFQNACWRLQSLRLVNFSSIPDPKRHWIPTNLAKMAVEYAAKQKPEQHDMLDLDLYTKFQLANQGAKK